MARFTKAERQEIVEDFAKRHGGTYDPKLFCQEVELVGEDHPAYGWFTWDDDKAAQQYRIWEARVFASGLKIRFEIETLETGPRHLKYIDAPLVLSPLEQRKRGGGYYVTGPEQMDEYVRQAHASLRSWLKRYQSALEYAGGSPQAIKRQISNLESSLNALEVVAAE